jgi:glycerol-3-phosphate O-acyltransferase
MEKENPGTETDKKTGGSETQTDNKKNVVELTQDKLDELINKAYAKGAKNAGSNNEEFDSLKNNFSKLQEELNKTKKEALLQEKINAYEVEDKEVFKLLVESAEKSEDFNIDDFTKSLKENRPNLFKQEKKVEEQKFYKTDSSNNQQEVSLADKIKGLSLRELEELSKNIN